MIKTSKKQPNLIDQNPVEALRDIVHETKDTITHDLGQEMVSDLWKQLLGTQENKSANQTETLQKGDLSEGQEISFKKIEALKPKVEAGIDYVREVLQGSDKIRHEDSRETASKIQEIQTEIAKLVKSSKELEAQFREVATVQMPTVNAGKYHENFFEWVASAIKHARMTVEDSLSWTKALSSKKDKRQYWAMFKKHGTTFGLSGERVVATQTG